jgi:hypothetical protein
LATTNVGVTVAFAMAGAFVAAGSVACAAWVATGLGAHAASKLPAATKEAPFKKSRRVSFLTIFSPSESNW